MSAVISGIGWVTAGGIGRGKDGHPFVTKEGPLPKLTRKVAVEGPYDRFGRMDEYTKLGLTAISYALRDAGLDRWEQKRMIGIVASTTHGCLKTDVDYFDTVIPQGGGFASPHLFAYTLPNSFLGEAAIMFGLNGISFVVSESSPWGLTSLQLALSIAAQGEHEAMLAGVCDLGGQPPFTTKASCLPGAVFVVLERVGRVAQTPYGSVVLDQGRATYHKGVHRVNFIELIEGCLERDEDQVDLSQLVQT
jgi:3-oxoacyl-[acyl-carrier-protein] synthase II